jgi:hypothetical protein
MRNGLENLDITEARLKEIGMEGFALPMKLSCETIPAPQGSCGSGTARTGRRRRLVRSDDRCGQAAAEESR